MSHSGGQYNYETGKVESGNYPKGHSLDGCRVAKDRGALLKDLIARRKKK